MVAPNQHEAAIWCAKAPSKNVIKRIEVSSPLVLLEHNAAEKLRKAREIGEHCPINNVLDALDQVIELMDAIPGRPNLE